jgi:hypothetical protein
MGLDVSTLLTALRGLGAYVQDRGTFRSQIAQADREFVVGSSYPCLVDRFVESGVARGQYFHQDLYVAQLINQADPAKHVDVGSRVDGFVAHVASFRPIEVLDLRPLRTSAENIQFRQLDLLAPGLAYEEYTPSLSCLHTLEHLGLGRYGDAVDYYGYVRGWANLTKMLRPGGTLYFSVPIGRIQRVEFNAHRIFSLPYLLQVLIDPCFEVVSFAYVDDDGELHRDQSVRSSAAGETFGLAHGCGIFELVRHPDVTEALGQLTRHLAG